ncbi:MAG TPA: TIGR00282 family metallophosphoesterase [Firmicutes bacterium]|nr:TIGR00282 family metallophosphoesterase [Bacillota bacterium]
MISVLFIGDICGKPGRYAVKKNLPTIVEQYNIDFVIANGENASHGRGLNYSHYKELVSYGINCITMGNHFFGADEILHNMDNYVNLIRPANFAENVPGIGTKVFKVKDKKLRVTNLIGMSEIQYLGQSNPFIVANDIVTKDDSDIHIIDFHAEATGEKGALARFFDGKVSAVIGTHTHVQTNDARILPCGTGFMSDVGSCCAYQSILGMEAEAVINRTAFGLPERFTVATSGEQQFNAVVLVFNEENKICSLKPIFIVSL